MALNVKTATVACAVLCGACFRAPVPMTQIDYQVNPPAKCLVVLMPGEIGRAHV